MIKPLLLSPLFVLSSCLFLPNIEGDGYTSCSESSECEPGRSCEKGYCAPPPWNDERFITRNLLSVQNLSDEAIPAGTAVAVRFAADGVLATSDIGIDGRFSFFTDAEGTLIAGEWREVPTFFDQGVVNVADNQKLILDEPLTPPFSLTFRGRINGAACDALYIGLEGDNNAGYSAPSMGLFALEGLSANAEVAPEEESVPTPVEQNIALDTAEHRYRFDVGGAVVDVDGACSFDIERLWVTPLPIEGVKVEGQSRVVFGGFE